MSTRTAPKSGSNANNSIGYNLAGIAILALLLAVGAAYLVDAIKAMGAPTLPSRADTETVSLTISGQELTVPVSWLRYGDQPQSGFANQIDLHVLLNPTDGGAPALVDVTLVPRSRARPSSTLLDGVYLHQFESETLGGVPGLVGKPLQADAGFNGETVWYDALSPDPFVAKCQAPLEAKQNGRCLRTVYLASGIAAIYSFDSKLLPSWRSFDTQMDKWLGQIGAL